MVDITAICAILLPAIIVVIVLVFAERKRKERNRLIESMLEKNADPSTLLPILEKSKNEEEVSSPTRYFKTGIMLVSLGVGAVICAHIAHKKNAPKPLWSWSIFMSIIMLYVLSETLVNK